MQTDFTLPQKTLRLWQIRIGIFGFALLFPIICVLSHSRLALCITVVAVLLFTAVIFIVIPLEFHKYHIYISEKFIKISYGVLIRTEKIVIRDKIIGIGLYRTPFSKKLHIAAVLVRTVRKSVFIPELTDFTANMIFPEKEDES